MSRKVSRGRKVHAKQMKKKQSAQIIRELLTILGVALLKFFKSFQRFFALFALTFSPLRDGRPRETSIPRAKPTPDESLRLVCSDTRHTMLQ